MCYILGFYLTYSNMSLKKIQFNKCSIKNEMNTHKNNQQLLLEQHLPPFSELWKIEKYKIYSLQTENLPM